MPAFLIAFLTLIPKGFPAEVLEGVAKNQRGEILYLEKHTVIRDEEGLNLHIQVEYSKPDGKLFARMTSDFSRSKTLPETTFEDLRFKSKSYIRLKDQDVEFQEIKNGKNVSRKTVPFNEAMVASQGFDNFIRMNFSRLETEPVKFKFGVLDHRDFFSLTGYRRPASNAENVEFGIKSSSWIVRLFAGEINVNYDPKTKRLKSFRGRSNILDDGGKPQDVSITYLWKNDL